MAKKNTKKTASKTQPSMVEMMKPMNNGMMNSCACANDCSGWGLAILRVVVGAAFLWHGVTKFMGFEGTKGFFTSLFGAAGPFLAGLVASVEVLAGIALIVGIWTRWASYLLVTIMLVAIVWAKKFAWPAIELDVVFVAALLALAWNGPGVWAVEKSCGCGSGCRC